eukprot:XP_027311580.1 uncharacterized protein LOC113843443 isoform X5 [Anas platyrhynchos]
MDRTNSGGGGGSAAASAAVARGEGAAAFPGNLLLSPADQFLFPTGGRLCQLITPAQPAFPLAAATVGAGRPPLREPACCGLLSPAPGLLAGFVGPCGARRGAASPRGVRR